MQCRFGLLSTRWLAPPVVGIAAAAGTAVALAAGSVVHVPDNPLGGSPPGTTAEPIA